MPLWTEEFATASWWLAVAKRDGDGRREYRWFVVERGDGFPTSQRYEALGLKAIDYGVNDIDAFVPAHRCIDVGKGNLSSMVDIYLSGRALIGAMACGFLRRVAREAHAYADARRIGRSPLSAIGYVRCRLEAVDGAGGEGYRCGSPTNITGQASLDSRVFTIFDGTNDLLSQQLAQHCLDSSDGRGLSEFLATWAPTAPAVSAHGLDLRFLDDGELGQEHPALAGRVIAYTFTAARVLQWAAETGADTERARRAAAFLKADIDRVRVEFDFLASLGADT